MKTTGDFHTSKVLPKRITKRIRSNLDFEERLKKIDNVFDIPQDMWDIMHTDGEKMAIYIQWKTILDNVK